MSTKSYTPWNPADSIRQDDDNKGPSRHQRTLNNDTLSGKNRQGKDTKNKLSCHSPRETHAGESKIRGVNKHRNGSRISSVSSPPSSTPVIQILQKQQSRPSVDGQQEEKKQPNNRKAMHPVIVGQSGLAVAQVRNSPQPLTTTMNRVPNTCGSNVQQRNGGDKVKVGPPKKSKKVDHTPKTRMLMIGDLIPKNHTIWSKSSVATPQNASSDQTPLVTNESFRRVIMDPPIAEISTAEFPSLGPLSNESLPIEQTLFTNSNNQMLKVKNAAKGPKNNKKIAAVDEELISKNECKEKLSNVGNVASKSSPCIGGDFSSAVDSVLTPKAREIGPEDTLLRLYQEGQFSVQTKGRQRIRPRRKKFSSLKKKVLEERLRQWRETKTAPGSDRSKHDFSSTVCIHGYCGRDEIEDDDEYDEIVENLTDMSRNIGTVVLVFIPRNIDCELNQLDVAAFVQFQTTEDAIAAEKCWNGLVLAGQKLECRVLTDDNILEHMSSGVVGSSPLDDKQWKEWCLKFEKRCESGMENSDNAPTMEVIMHDVLTEDDFEDDECLEESLRDIENFASEFVNVVGIRVDERSVIISLLGGRSVAQNAVDELGTMVMGGVRVLASVCGSSCSQYVGGDVHSNDCIVELRNVITEDDLTDEDCLQESISDVRELAQRYGSVVEISVSTEDIVGGRDEVNRFLCVTYSSSDEAVRSINGFHGMVVCGQSISASLYKPPENGVSSIPGNPTGIMGKSPMFSGGKIIPERFAECKRVPKIPNSALPRKYATLIDDPSVKELLVEMLSELMRLQQRSVDDKNSKARRRIVMGLREVARGIRSHKVKLVVMANNLDEYGAIDDKLQEIITLCHDEDVPIFYELNKRNLGKALGKSIKIAVAGVQNADGANQQFKKLLKLAFTAVTK